MRERVLKSWKIIPLNSLVNYVKEGIVTIADLQAAGMSDETANSIRDQLKDADNSAFSVSIAGKTLTSYRQYLDKFPNGLHVQEINILIENLDKERWDLIQSNICKETLEQYKQDFPQGKYIEKCNELLDDLPWLDAVRNNTIQDYDNYASNYPGLHEQEIVEKKNILNDDKDWNNAVVIGTTDSYRLYIKDHPSGKHVEEAKRRIQASAGKDLFLSELRDDCNSHGVLDIQHKIKNGVISKSDLINIFGNEIADAIEKYEKPADLPGNKDPKNLSEKLEGDSTEIYFWGYRGSGKTCALGSVISSLKKHGNLKKQNCKGYDYMTRLSNIFATDNVCILPPSTENANIQEMIFEVEDSKKKKHKITLIDLAGEMIEIAYDKLHPNSGYNKTKEDFQSLKMALSYLKDTRNNKIHFFVVEYGSHSQSVGPYNNLKIEDLLDNMLSFLVDNKVFSKTTVGVYVLVTKCDKIMCSEEEMPQKAGEYVVNNFSMLWDNIKKACNAKEASIRDLRTISFSVGKVIAKDLCLFNDKYTSKIIDKFITKTYPEGDSLFDKFLRFLRS